MDVLPSLYGFLIELDSPTREQVKFEQIFHMIPLASRLKDNILLAQSSEHDPAVAPAVISPAIQIFLSEACRLQEEVVQGLWGALKEVIWSEHVASVVEDSGHLAVHLEHGHSVGLSAFFYLFNLSPLPNERGHSLSYHLSPVQGMP